MATALESAMEEMARNNALSNPGQFVTGRLPGGLFHWKSIDKRNHSSFLVLFFVIFDLI